MTAYYPSSRGICSGLIVLDIVTDLPLLASKPNHPVQGITNIIATMTAPLANMSDKTMIHI